MRITFWRAELQALSGSPILEKLQNLPREQFWRGLHRHMALALEHRDRAPRQHRLHALDAGAINWRALPAEQQQGRDVPGPEPFRAQLVARHGLELAQDGVDRPDLL